MPISPFQQMLSAPLGQTGGNASQLFALLNSQQGQNLDAGSWNALRDQAAYAQNSAGGPQPWQGTYYSQQPQQSPVALRTGTGEQQQSSYDPTLATALSQKYFSPQTQPSFGRFGNQLQVNGQTVSNDIGGAASAAGMSPDNWVQQQVANAGVPKFDMGQAFQGALSDPRLQGLPMLQRLGAVTGAAGMSPADYAAIQQRQAEAAVKLQQQGLDLQKGQLGILDEKAKGLGFDNWQQIATSYGNNPDAVGNPALKNTALIPGGFKQNPIDPTGPPIHLPDQWKFVQPDAVNDMMQTAQQMGMSKGLSSAQSSAAAQARFAQLHSMGSPASSGPAQTASNMSGYEGVVPSTDPTGTAANAVNLRHYLGQQLQIGGGLDQSISSFGRSVDAHAHNSMLPFLNFLRGFVGGKTSDIQPWTPDQVTNTNY